MPPDPKPWSAGFVVKPIPKRHEHETVLQVVRYGLLFVALGFIVTAIHSVIY